jgi:hypothetical protein
MEAAHSLAMRINSVSPLGSSSVFKNALAPFAFRHSAFSTNAVLRRPR